MAMLILNICVVSLNSVIWNWQSRGLILFSMAQHPMLRTQFFIVMGLVDAVPMIAVGIAMYVLFAVA